MSSFNSSYFPSHLRSLKNFPDIILLYKEHQWLTTVQEDIKQLLEFYYPSILLTKMPSRYPGAITQDWEPVVLHKSKTKAQELRDPKAVNQALRSGAPVQTIKKFDAGSNKKTAAPDFNARKLDESNDAGTLGRVPAEVRQAIQKARLEKKMSQAELAKLINERPQVVQEYENGKAVPNQAVLAKLEKALGVKLRGKIGK